MENKQIEQSKLKQKEGNNKINEMENKQNQ